MLGGGFCSGGASILSVAILDKLGGGWGVVGLVMLLGRFSVRRFDRVGSIGGGGGGALIHPRNMFGSFALFSFLLGLVRAFDTGADKGLSWHGIYCQH